MGCWIREVGCGGRGRAGVSHHVAREVNEERGVLQRRISMARLVRVGARG